MFILKIADNKYMRSRSTQIVVIKILYYEENEIQNDNKKQ